MGDRNVILDEFGRARPTSALSLQYALIEWRCCQAMPHKHQTKEFLYQKSVNRQRSITINACHFSCS